MIAIFIAVAVAGFISYSSLRSMCCRALTFPSSPASLRSQASFRLVANIRLLFLHLFRVSFIVLLSISPTLLAGFVIMNLLGFSLNSLSTLGLELSIGILVDDSIVILENIRPPAQRRRSMFPVPRANAQPVSIIIQAPDNTVLQSLAGQLEQKFRQVPGLHDVTNSAAAALPELDINVDRERAARAGVSAQSIGSAVRLAYSGVVAGMERNAALQEAGPARLRAILMTSLTIAASLRQLRFSAVAWPAWLRRYAFTR